jgi:protein arginine N-methyltransferase 1
MADARARFLKPGGHLIPLRDTLFTAPIEAAETWAANAGPETVLGFDYAAARQHSFSRWTRGIFQSSQLLSEPRVWAEIDYLTRTPSDTDVCGTVECVVTRPGTAHGLAVWFVASLAEGVSFDTGPDHTTVYQTALFPWPEPQALAAGDLVRGTLQARMAGEDYLWSWNTVIERADRPPVSFRQTDFPSHILPMRELRKRADTFVPRLGADGEVDAFALGMMDGRASVGDVARAVMERFPGRFATWEDAVSRVGRLSEQYAA